MVDITKLFLSGSKVVDPNYVETNESVVSSSSSSSSSSPAKTKPNHTVKKNHRPRVPSIIKYMCWLVWMVLVGYLLYQQDSMNYVWFCIRIVWLIASFVAIRDGGIHLTSVEYNLQTKGIVGMVCNAISLWILIKQPNVFTFFLSSFQKCSEYCALGVLAAFQAFENPFAIMYCRPTPIKLSQLHVIEDYIALPVLLTMMLVVDGGSHSVDGNDEFSNMIRPSGFLRSDEHVGIFRAVVMLVTSYKFFRSFMDYHQASKLSSTTVPMKHQFTATLDVTVKSASTAVEDVPNLWRIYGNTYDMTDYVQHHPGGVEAIMLGANRDDSTELFQSYHPFTIKHAKAVLKKYRINTTSNVNHDSSSTSSTTTSTVAAVEDSANHSPQHDNDLFYEVLVRRVRKTLEDANIDPVKDRTPTKIRYGYYLFLIAAIITSCVAHCRGSLLGSFLFGVFGWLLGAIGHDGGHFAVSRIPVVNDIAVWGMSMLCNPIMWQHQHTYAHHCYTNEFDRDPDLHHFDMFLRYHKRYIPHPVYKNQTSKLFVIAAFGFTCFGQCYWIPWRFIQERSLYGTVAWTDRKRFFRSLLLFGHFIIYTTIIMFVPFFVHKSTIMAGIATLTPMVTSGLLFAFCSQIGHVTEMCAVSKTDDNILSKRHPDARQSWAAGQVESTNDFCPQSNFWHLIANGLTLQVEHHLFPGLNHCHLQLIQPIVEKTCQEYGVNYKKYNSWSDVMQATFEYLNKLAQE